MNKLKNLIGATFRIILLLTAIPLVGDLLALCVLALAITIIASIGLFIIPVMILIGLCMGMGKHGRHYSGK